MYWIYDIPTELLGLLFILAFAAFAVVGVFITRRIPGPRIPEDGWREHVGILLEGAFAFFGLLLALVAIAAYDNYTDARSKTAAEASEVGSLYRIVSTYPEPIRGQLQADLREYTSYVIEKAWPLQRNGIIPTGAVPLVTKFQDRLASFEPQTNGQSAVYSATLSQLNDFVKARRERLHLVEVGLPAALWEVLIAGALLTIALTWLLPVKSFKNHMAFSVMSSLIVSLLIFLTADMDHPFRGGFSVDSHAFDIIQHDLMR